MIDITKESLISLADAARLLPARRAGKKVHVSCVYRWTATGCKGVTLDSVQIGGTRCTSREALGRFVVALTERSGVAPRATPAPTPKARRRAMRRAEAVLDRAGI